MSGKNTDLWRLAFAVARLPALYADYHPCTSKVAKALESYHKSLAVLRDFSLAWSMRVPWLRLRSVRGFRGGRPARPLPTWRVRLGAPTLSEGRAR